MQPFTIANSVSGTGEFEHFRLIQVAIVTGSSNRRILETLFQSLSDPLKRTVDPAQTLNVSRYNNV